MYTAFVSVLHKAQTLQTDWLQMHAKVSQRLTNLVDAHRLASEEFWLPLANLQGDLAAARRSIDALVAGGVSRQPLEPTTYAAQLEGLKRVSEQLVDADKRLSSLRGVGDRIIDLLMGETRGEEEKALRNEITSVLREVAMMARDVTASCEHQKMVAADHLTTAQTLEVRPHHL